MFADHISSTSLRNRPLGDTRRCEGALQRVSQAVALSCVQFVATEVNSHQHACTLSTVYLS